MGQPVAWFEIISPDAERAKKFYADLFGWKVGSDPLMGDYSLETLDMSRPAVKEHIHLCSFLALDALDPLKTLSFLRHKILYIHSTNMYDNLPDEEILRRDGGLFYVHVRAYVPVKRAALTGFSASQTSSPRSRLPLGLIPHATPAARKPAGRPASGPRSLTCAGAGTQRE